MGKGFIVGFGEDEHTYKIGVVTYTVSANFAKPFRPESRTYADRLKSYIGGDFADLTVDEDEGTISDGYVCSAAGKEE